MPGCLTGGETFVAGRRSGASVFYLRRREKMAFARAKLGEGCPFAPREIKLTFGYFRWGGVKNWVRGVFTDRFGDILGVKRFQGGAVKRRVEIAVIV